MTKEEIVSYVKNSLGIEISYRVFVRRDGGQKTLSLLIGDSEFIFAYFNVVDEEAIEFCDIHVDWTQINILSILGYSVDENIEKIKEYLSKWNGC